MKKTRVNFWVHIARKPKEWWSDNINRENLELWGFILGITVPLSLACISPFFISLLVGHRDPWQLLGLLLVIPAALFSWWIVYQDSPEYDFTDDTSNDNQKTEVKK
jgi:hypothetical protein